MVLKKEKPQGKVGRFPEKGHEKRRPFLSKRPPIKEKARRRAILSP
jgi:hypothetical protein